MCKEKSIKQIEKAIAAMQQAHTLSTLHQHQNIALAFIHAAFEKEQLTEKEKHMQQERMRQVYRQQLIMECDS